MNPEQIAKVAFEVNKAYCESIGDNSFASWEESPQWQRQTCINGVQFHLENPNSTPSQSHENWLKQKEIDGWKYGAVKNPEKREHPCFVPYEQLPPQQRTKEFLFLQVVRSLEGFLDKPESGIVNQE